MAEFTTLELPDFVALAPVMWLKGLNSVSSVMRESGMVAVMPISENTGNTRQFSEIDSNEYLSYKGEGDQAARSKHVQGYKKTMTAYRVAENAEITYEMRTQNKYPEVLAEVMSGARKGVNTMDLDLTHRITFGAAATTYTDRDGRTIDISCGDTFQLFYSLHTLNGSSTTFRNILANNPRLSKGALEAMERMIVENSYSHLGEKQTFGYDILFTTDDPNTINTAREYLQSTADPDAAHAGVTNVYAGKYRLVVLPRLATDKDGNVDTNKRYYWGLASSQMKPIKFGVWEEPHMMVGDTDVQTDGWEVPIRAGYGICNPGARGICLSKGDGSA